MQQISLELFSFRNEPQLWKRALSSNQDFVDKTNPPHPKLNSKLRCCSTFSSIKLVRFDLPISELKKQATLYSRSGPNFAYRCRQNGSLEYISNQHHGAKLHNIFLSNLIVYAWGIVGSIS
ncbi:hypothetical protein CDAR_268891 [Caerostris darwini]|uniref:Uncharacterized protein n=1 Tax=Caerostris darwini TaxID=1538125 RepID=A0AAV4V4U3_9ARAC|nr:hypothetical protein CDAR_268891 [Caerostris darwini]